MYVCMYVHGLHKRELGLCNYTVYSYDDNEYKYLGKEWLWVLYLIIIKSTLCTVCFIYYYHDKIIFNNWFALVIVQP